MFGGLLAGTDQSSRQFCRHNLYDQTDSQSEHLMEQLGLCSDKHRQIDEQLLSQHGGRLVVAVRLMDQRSQLVLRQRRDNRVLVCGWHADGDLFLAYQKIGNRLRQILHSLAQHTSAMAYDTPHFLLASLLVETLQQIFHQNGMSLFQYACVEVQSFRVHLQIRKKITRLH